MLKSTLMWKTKNDGATLEGHPPQINSICTEFMMTIQLFFAWYRLIMYHRLMIRKANSGKLDLTSFVTTNLTAGVRIVSLLLWLLQRLRDQRMNASAHSQTSEALRPCSKGKKRRIRSPMPPELHKSDHESMVIESSVQRDRLASIKTTKFKPAGDNINLVSWSLREY